MQERRNFSAPRQTQWSEGERRSVQVLGDEPRDLPDEERNSARARRLEYNVHARRCGKPRTRAAGSANAAHGCGMGRISGIAGRRLMMMAVAVLMLVRMRRNGAAMMPVAQRHQHARVAAQRQCRHEQREQESAENGTHG